MVRVLARRCPPPPSASSALPVELAAAGFRRTRHLKSGQEEPPMPLITGPKRTGAVGREEDQRSRSREEQGC